MLEEAIEELLEAHSPILIHVQLVEQVRQLLYNRRLTSLAQLFVTPLTGATAGPMPTFLDHPANLIHML